jgi:hypothetical protein
LKNSSTWEEGDCVSSTTDGQEIDQGKQLVQMLIRIWHARSSAHAGRNEDASSKAQMLAEDVLSFTLTAKTDRGPKGYVCAWGMTEPGRALAASRALQEAFEGFRGAAPAGKTTVAVVVDKSAAGEMEAHSSRPSLELTSLLDVASPGQVLITQSFYKGAETCQPLQLRSFPARAGVYEWLWTSGERLEQLRSDPEFGPALVEEPRAAEKPAAIGPLHPASTIPLQTVAVHPPPPTISQQTPSDETSEAGEDRFDFARLRSRKVAIAAVLAVVVAAAGAGLWGVWSANHRKPHGPVNVPELPKWLGSEIVPLGPAAEIPLAGKIEVTLPALIPSRSGCSTDDRIQIPYLLAMAEANLNRGQYDASMRQYKQVLSCDPGNRTARQGLARVLEDVNEGH